MGDRTSQIVQFCLRNDTDWDVPLVINGEQHMPSDKPGIIMRHKLATLMRDHEPDQASDAPVASR